MNGFLIILKNNLISFLPSFIIDFLTKGHKRSVKAKQNIIASFGIKGLSIIVGFILVPLTLNYLDPVKYGIWITLTSIIGWFGFFDIGLGNGLRNKLAEAIATNDQYLARIYISTTYALLIIILGMVIILFSIINQFLDWTRILNAPAELKNELSVLVLIVFALFLIQLILKIIGNILMADQRPALNNFLNPLANFFSLILIFIITKVSSGSLLLLGIIISSTPVIVYSTATLYIFKYEYKKYSPSIKHIKFIYSKALLGLGSKFFIIQIAAILLYQTNNIIISHILGPEQVTPYNIAFRYFSLLMMIFSIILTPYWSAFTDAWVKKELYWIKGIMKKLNLLWILFLLLSIIMLAGSKWIYHFWIGDKVTIPFSISALVAAWVVLNSWNNIYSFFLNGVSKIKMQLYLGIFAALFNVPLAILGGKQFGIVGILLANIVVLIFGTFLYPMQYRKIINGTAKGIMNE